MISQPNFGALIFARSFHLDDACYNKASSSARRWFGGLKVVEAPVNLLVAWGAMPPCYFKGLIWGGHGVPLRVGFMMISEHDEIVPVHGNFPAPPVPFLNRVCSCQISVSLALGWA